MTENLRTPDIIGISPEVIAAITERRLPFNVAVEQIAEATGAPKDISVMKHIRDTLIPLTIREPKPCPCPNCIDERRFSND